MVHIFFRTAGFRGRLPLATAILALLLALGGCASVPPPNDAMNQAQSQLQAARDAGAADYAPVDLGFAQDKFQQAQAAIVNGKYANAANLAEESQADAELAAAKARLGAARSQIQAKAQENDRLRTEGEQAEAASEREDQQTAPASASSSTELPTEDMPAPASSTLSAPPPGAGFQTLPVSGQPPGSDQPPGSVQHPDPTNQGGQP